MSGNILNNNSVTGSKRSTEKMKRQRSTFSSSSSKKCKLTRTSQATVQISSGYALSNNKDLASTQKWRELLLNNEARNGPLARSEEIYRENVTQLLNDLDDYARNPAKWSKYKKNHLYCKIISFTVSWKKQLLKENTNKKVSLNKENTCDIINDRFNLLTSFYHELSTVMKFSDSQKYVIDCKVKELNDVRSELVKLLSQSSLITQLKNNDLELGEARQQSDECREEPTKTQDGLKEVNLKSNESSLGTELSKNTNHEQNEAKLQADACLDGQSLASPQNCLKGKSRVILRVDPQAILDVCLQEKEKQLNELKKQLDWAAKKQKETEEELKKQLDSAAKKQKETEVELKKQLDSAAKKLKETEVELKKQLDSAAKKQKETEGELKRQLDSAAKKQKETELELAETREQLQSFVSKSREMTQTKQKEVNRKLSEIETSLLMKNPSYRPRCQVENESLNKEDKLLKNIKAIIEYESNAAKSDSNCERSTTESVLDTNSSSSLRVSEYEVHLVTLIAAFLRITPFGVSAQTIYSYVVNIDNAVDLQFIVRLMRKFPSFFKEVAGEPGFMEKCWSYLDLKPVITI